ncbi:leucine-rich repeat-containing protein 43-like isoform X1 [Silurus meridionalis]|uniref:leucine-rich repeat-containing protein 43-like isoform X1 n=1 Tax=Silurus meridionalis TaxID=175797 RepID=UPI001EEB2ECA|nr:leucine-rich repeat-containing protein 43-like isoform X1 [Silurus meridionalis]XP_046697457.1 leucine-rich repeat-containing protein 43-like isoform X1 [Silurus meridionalis]
MACHTLTSAIDKLVHSLCLESFPCGRGSWRKPTLQDSKDWDDEDDDEESTGAQFEELDNLCDLLRSPLSPWHQEASWSPQTLDLRELAVKAPKKINADRIYSSLTTLRVVDKGVSVIDDGLLKFRNLEQLVLTVNNIAEVPSKNLPKTLKVLELYGNQISNLESLNTELPPHLLHLGLGNNRLGSPEDLQYFAVSRWPQLMSLDLSWAGYTEQYALVDALSTLPRLRSLVLEGNPLTLTTLYPGFTLDSLDRLLYLDETRISPEDRRRYRGLAKLRASVSEEAEVIVCVKKIKGVPNSLLLNDAEAEFPLVNYSYSVSYEFFDESQSQKSVHAEDQTSQNILQRLTPVPCTSSEHQDHALSVPVAMNWTTTQAWAEEIEFNHSSTHRIRDLAALKNFFLRGLWITVEEQKVLSWPASRPESSGTKASANKKEKKASSAGTKSKVKKKKKESELELIHEQPIKQTLGSVHVKLKDLLEGKSQSEEQYDMVVKHSIRPEVSKVKQKSKKSNRENKEENPTSKKGKVSKEMATDASADERKTETKTLTVEFNLRLNKWTSDSQAFDPNSTK